MKVCFCASSGGHLEEISRLTMIQQKYDSIMITEKSPFNELTFCSKVYYVSQINRREPLFLIKFLRLFVIYSKIMKEEKPDCIISTGALVTYPMCLIGKMKHKKIIYIESFARVEKGSLTGKLMYHIADLFIVQWKELLQVYPKAVYGGKIF